MTTLTKLVLGAMGRLRPEPSRGDAAPRIELPSPRREGGPSLRDAFARRRSTREFLPDALDPATLSDLLWAAGGINREGGGRTTPSALDAQEIVVYAALPSGAYRYDPEAHALVRVADADVRCVTGYQDFVDQAPLDLVYVADHARLRMVPPSQQPAFAHVAAGAAAQDVYLACAAAGLGTVLRAWIDREAIAKALGLPPDQEVLLSQTVGWPATGTAAGPAP